MKVRLLSVIALSSVIMLGGCASTKTMLEHRNLAVESKMSSTVFLDPVPVEKKVILVQVRNTSDQSEFNPTDMIKAKLIQAGYTITDNPDDAYYMLQANILKVGKVDKLEIDNLLGAGYGGSVDGVLLGAALGAYSGSGRSILSGGLVGAALGTVADALVKDVTYSVVTDIQLSERAKSGVILTEHNSATLAQGLNSQREISSNETTDWRRHQTRIISSANKVNLKLDDAKPELLAGISRSITGIFG